MKTRTPFSIAITVALFACTSQLLAQSGIEEILVTGRSIEDTVPLDLSRYGNRLEIIQSVDLERQSFTDIGQALQMLVPGLHIKPKNGAFDYFDASLQGSRGVEILWLIDGVRITNRLYNGTSPLDTLPTHMIERIEVLKGGQGIFYGTQSVGGVVNIVTKGFQTSSGGAIGAGVHSNDGQSVNAYYRAGTIKHKVVAYASQDKAEGYRPYRNEDIQPSTTDRERGYDVSVAGLKYGWTINETSSLSMQMHRTWNELDFLRPFRTAHSVNERTEDIVTLKYDLQLNAQVGLYIKAYHHKWDTRHSRIYNQLDGNGNLTGGFRVLNDRSYWGYTDQGLNAMLKFSMHENFETVVGLDHQYFSGADDVWRIADQEEKVNAAFLQLRTTKSLFENTALALGVRRNNASNTENSTVWNISGQHDFTDTLYLRATLGTSFRLPDAEALFLNEYYDDDQDGVPDGGWFAIGNPDLKPEKSRNLNIGIGGSFANLTYELIGFKREITDYIASYVPLTIAGVTGESFINTRDKVEIEGIELITSMALAPRWQADFSYTLNKAELNKNGTQLPSIPRTESKFRLGYQSHNDVWGLSLLLNYVGEVNERRAQKRGNYAVMDLSGFYHLGADQQHRLVLRIENLADREYATRVDLATRDTGGSYIFDNLGVDRTVHLSYTYQF